MDKGKYIRLSGFANQRMVMDYKANSGSSNDCQIKACGKIAVVFLKDEIVLQGKKRK